MEKMLFSCLVVENSKFNVSKSPLVGIAVGFDIGWVETC